MTNFKLNSQRPKTDESDGRGVHFLVYFGFNFVCDQRFETRNLEATKLQSIKLKC